MENNFELTIVALAPLIRRREISPVELTRFLLERIDRLQPSINAYIAVAREEAMAQARRAEKEILRGFYRGVLHGIPINLKDLFHVRGFRTTAGSRIMRRSRPHENAVIVNRLLECGCVLLGKTNLHEFAYGPTSVNPHYGPVRNPWDTSRISGGSSGGSAASVVTAQAIASFGTDTGGSIRIPAAACGCVGLKPTYGRVSLKGVVPLSESLDHAGPLCRCVTDAAFLLNAVAEPPLWPGDAWHQVEEIRQGIESLRIGVPRQYFFDRVQAEVRSIVMDSVAVLQQLGARIVELKLEGMGETEELAALITGAEAYAYHEEWLARRPSDYGRDVRLRLMKSARLRAAVYIRAQKRRLAYAERLTSALEQVDVLLAPTIPILPPPFSRQRVRIARAAEDVRSALLRLTRPANLAGLPAISVPCGFSSGGLPVGLQLIGRHLEEVKLLRVAHAYEQATPWHLAFPPEAGNS